jgi:tetratricopeptide (TPR) repeat protein
MTGRHEKAEAEYHETFQLYSSIPDTNAMSVILINLGDEYAKTGRTELAAETELRAIKLKEDNRDYRKLAFYYQKLGELFIDRDNAKWEEYAMKALALTKTKENTTTYATIAVYNDLGAIWRIKNNYTIAAAYYDTMYQKALDAGYRKGIATATSERALLLFDMGKYTEALPIAKEAYEIIQDTDDNYKIAYEAILISRILLKLDRPVEAVSLLKKAQITAQNADLMPEVMESKKYLAQAFQYLGNYKEAFEYQSQWINLKDSVDGIEVRNTLNDIETRFETEKKQQLIDRLNEKNLEHEKRNKLFIGLLLASFAGLIMLIFIIWLRNKTLRQNRILHLKEQEIMSLENLQLGRELDYKSRELTTAAVHLINKNEVLNNLKSKIAGAGEQDLQHLIHQIDQNLNLDHDWLNFSRHFEEVHPDFFRKLKEKYPLLTPNEERLCAYLRINMNTKEISQMLNVTIAAVDKSRNRLRKKLELDPEVNLNEFLALI